MGKDNRIFFRSDMERIRLQKYVSDCGLMSRRAAENEIRRGAFTVNGITAMIGDKITPGTDKVEYNGEPVTDAGAGRCVCIMLNKPTGYVTTMDDSKDGGRRTVADLVSDVGIRVYPAGRLDLNSEGLLIMTNDGELCNTLMHPRNHIPKLYHVKLPTALTPEQLKALNSPMIIDGYKIKPVHAEVITLKPNETVLAMTLYEGRNRQIRKMCESLGLSIKSLRRVAIGDIHLGNLKPGTWRFLTKSQIEYLKNAAK